MYEMCAACGTEKPIRPHLTCCVHPTLPPTRPREKRNEGEKGQRAGREESAGKGQVYKGETEGEEGREREKVLRFDEEMRETSL